MSRNVRRRATPRFPGWRSGQQAQRHLLDALQRVDYMVGQQADVPESVESALCGLQDALLRWVPNDQPQRPLNP